MREKNKQIIEYLIAFSVPVLVMTGIYIIYGIWPFGNNTIMTGDTTYQYVDYLSYYKTIIFGQNDFIYSLSKNMGGEMAGFAAYYLFSPLNLLTLPFPREKLYIGIGLIIALAPGLASLSMYYLLDHIDESKKRTALILSFCYGLSAYIIVYNEVFQYYPNIILLPIIILCLRDILEGKKGLDLLYILLLGFAVFNNYYTAYMICIFLIIYSVYYYFYKNKSFKEYYRNIIYFVTNSLLAVGLSCITLIPAVLSLQGEKDNYSVGAYLTFSPWTYFSKLYSGSFFGDFGGGRPNIYCGIIVTVLFLLMILDDHLSKKIKLLSLAMMIFFWVDFCFNPMNAVWHGFNQPIGFPYRQAFLVVFFSILTVFENTDIDQIYNKRSSLIIMLIFLLYSILILIKKVDNIDVLSVTVTGIFFVMIVWMMISKNRYRYNILLIITIADLIFNAGYSFYHFSFTSIDEFLTPLSRITEPVEYIKENDDTLYRMEKDYRRTHNDAFMYDYAGLTHFSSSEKKATINYMGDLGYRNNGNWSMYNHTNTALADSILGIKYFLSEFDAIGKPYINIKHDSDKGYSIYKNPYALPLMMEANEKVKEVGRTENPFKFQNDIANGIAGSDVGVLREQKAEMKENEDGSVQFDMTIQDDGILYAYFDGPGLQEAVIYLDGDEWGKYFGEYEWNVVDLLKRKKGEKVKVEIKPSSDSNIKVDAGYFAIADDIALAGFSKKIQSSKTVLQKNTSSKYTGMYDIEGDTILFSIPMDKGWHLYIDGKEYDLNEACGHLMSAKVIPGKHEVELIFIPPGRKAGYIVSILALILTILYIVMNNKNKTIYRSEKKI